MWYHRFGFNPTARAAYKLSALQTRPRRALCSSLLVVVGAVNDLNRLSTVLLAVNAAGLNVLNRLDVGTDRTSLLEVTTLLLRTNSSGDCDTDSDDGSSNTHDGSISRRLLALRSVDHSGFSYGVDDLSGGRGNHVSELVGDTDEGRTESRWGQLAQVDGNDSPGTLDEELDHETRCGQTTLGSGENPGRDKAAGDESSADDHAATTEPLRSVSEDSTANTGTSLHENRGASGTGGAEMLLLLHEGGVAVLASVGVVVELI